MGITGRSKPGEENGSIPPVSPTKERWEGKEASIP